MGEPSAILAINSLDRFTVFNNIIATQTLSPCGWLAGTTQIANNSVYGPRVGAKVISAASGWPADSSGNKIVCTITSIGPTIYFNINLPTIGANLNVPVTQTYTAVQASAQQPVSNALVAQYEDSKPYSNNFIISSPGALIYGYINRIIVSQIQLQYNIPTVCMGKNDTFVISKAGSINTTFTIPHGFYYADELAATLQTLIRADPATASLNMNVVFSPRDGFIFTSSSSTPFYFPDPVALFQPGTPTYILDIYYKTYRLLGMTISNSIPAVNQTSFDYPNFLYTPYIDIYSDVLTNYQNIKDTNTSVEKPKGLVARIYVSGTGQIQTTGSISALGTEAFVMTSDLNTPKVIRWTPDVAVPSIDFQLLDQYGDLIPGPEQGYSTEFQMTLLCVEGRD